MKALLGVVLIAFVVQGREDYRVNLAWTYDVVKNNKKVT